MSTPADVPGSGDLPMAAGVTPTSAPHPPYDSAGPDERIAIRRRGRWPEFLVLLLVLFFGTIIRMWLLVLGDLGDSFDTGIFAAWSRGMVELGLGEFLIPS